MLIILFWREGEEGVVLSRLSSFMPAMQAANEELETEIAAGTVSRRNIETSDEECEESYIEMVWSPFLSLSVSLIPWYPSKN